jgi:hypothetical protein
MGMLIVAVVAHGMSFGLINTLGVVVDVLVETCIVHISGGLGFSTVPTIRGAKGAKERTVRYLTA